MASSSKAISDSLSQIVGKALTSVEFVMDYVQLRFDGAVLTAYIWPSVSLPGRTLKSGENCYRDALCERIGIEVENTSFVEENDLAIYFKDGAVMRISLRAEDYRSIEAVYFVGEDGVFWVV